jgi:hypothetical protein
MFKEKSGTNKNLKVQKKHFLIGDANLQRDVRKRDNAQWYRLNGM